MNRFARLFRSVSQDGGLLVHEVADEAPPQKDLPSLPHIINEIGFGRAQMQVFFTGGAIWFADASELLVVSAASEAVETEFSLTPLQRSSFITVVFCGVLLGNFFGGSFGDAYGRRIPIIFSFLGIFLFSILSAFSWSYLSLATLRFCVGLCIGLGQPSETALIAEVSPAKCRVLCFCCTSVLWAFGEMLAGTMIWYDDPTMYHLHWRELVAASAVPALIFGVASYLLMFESPYFLATTGKQEEAVKVLQEMRAANGLDKEVSSEFAVPQVVTPSVSHQLGVVFSWQQLPITMVMCLSTFLLNIVLYGALYAFATILPQEARGEGARSPAAQQVIGACWEIPGYILGGILGSFVDRRSVSQLYMWSTLLSFVAVAIAPHGSSLFLVGYYGVKVFPAIGFTVLYLFVAEVFPTDCRVTGTAICFSFGRIGAMCGSPVFELIEESTGDYRVFMWAIAAAFVVNSSCLWLMPESKLAELDEKDGKNNVYYGAVH